MLLLAAGAVFGLAILVLTFIYVYSMTTYNISFFQVVIFIYITSETYAKVSRYEEEYFFYDPVSKVKVRFSSIDEESSVHLSVVVPAYNEEQRRNMR